MVPRAGLEPAQRERRGILNPLCLPIPPPGHAILYCDALTEKLNTIFVLLLYAIRLYIGATHEVLDLRGARRDLNLGKVALYLLYLCFT